MQSRMFNNPALAQGLGGLVESFIGNPGRTGQAELAASQALLNNQTAQFRDAIGDTGLEGDLASMMIRALQAGPEFSGNAPKIGQSAIQMGALGFGSPELTPSGPVAALMQQAMAGGGRRGGRSSGGSTGGGAPSSRDLTQSELTRLSRLVREAGFEGTEGARVTGAIVDTFTNGGFATLDQAARDVLPNVGRETVEVPDETNPAGTMLSRLFGMAGDGIDGSGFDPTTEERLVIPGAGAPAASPQDTVSVLNQAREAIASGKDPVAVAERLREMGIDPSQL